MWIPLVAFGSIGYLIRRASTAGLASVAPTRDLRHDSSLVDSTHPPTGWESKDGALERTFVFDNFLGALGFVNAVGEAAELADHHPDILMHDYKQVTLRWRTHSADAITDKDHALARRSDELALA